MDVVERFLKLVSFDTTSDEFCQTCPSSANQLLLGQEIVSQMKSIGIDDARIDEFGYVYGTIPANCDKNMPVYGLIAHMDTSSDAPGRDIKARITEPYEGGDIVLNEEKNIILSPADFTTLSKHVGKRLIVTDGTTLLGADNKAGVAEILTAAELIINSEKPHPTVKIAFTPDEEIGRGTDKFDLAGFGADYGYTVDGGRIGELEYENFNAASASIEINGRSAHPGDAKGKMINAALAAMELNSLLPAMDIPSRTEGYEGFFHLADVQGNVEHAHIRYLIRDHDKAVFAQRKNTMERAVMEINARYGENTAVLTMKDGYYNMREKIESCMFLIDQAASAMRELGIEPVTAPIRGGTDGAQLSFKGLPCPNLCAGGENAHGRFEYIPADDMEKISLLLALIMWNAAK